MGGDAAPAPGAGDIAEDAGQSRHGRVQLHDGLQPRGRGTGVGLGQRAQRRLDFVVRALHTPIAAVGAQRHHGGDGGRSVGGEFGQHHGSLEPRLIETGRQQGAAVAPVRAISDRLRLVQMAESSVAATVGQDCDVGPTEIADFDQNR